MDDIHLKKALDDIQDLIGKGELEQAYTQLVKLLESSEEYAELADIARVNQADLYTWKAQELIGRLSGDESRRTQSQLADNALKIVRQLKTGKLYFEPEIKPHSSKAWRYYVTGGIGALVVAAGVWYFLSRQEEECVTFDDQYETRVMILPFLDVENEQPAIDIMDELNEWIEQTPTMRDKTIAQVHRKFDIQAQYPSSADAVEIAQNCDVQMLVWGKVRTRQNNSYTLDVRYRLLNAGGVLAAGDTVINRLLEVNPEASLTSDVEAAGRMLYLALANYKRVPIAASLMQEMNKMATVSGLAGDSVASAPVDTMRSFLLADQYLVQKDMEKAKAEYDKVLVYHPDNATAHTKRGALLFQQKKYEAAVRDFEAVPIAASAPALKDAKITAYLKTSQPAKAEQELVSAQKEGYFDSTAIADKRKQIQDSTAVLERSRDKWERKPKTSATRLQSAKANLGLGEFSKAETQAKEVLKSQPTNTEAVRIVVEAQLQKGDTTKAKKILQTAEKAGVDPKSIRLSPLKKILQSSGGQ